MTTTATRPLQPAQSRLEAFVSRVMRPLCALTVAGSLAGAQIAPAFAADLAPSNKVTFDVAKIAEKEIITGTGITFSDLGEFAPLAIDLLARGFPPIGILKDIFKAGMDVKGKIEAKAQRAEDVARMKAVEALLFKVSIAMAEESERQAVRFEALRADNRVTHDKLEAATRERDELKALLVKAAEMNKKIAEFIEQQKKKATETVKYAPAPKPKKPEPHTEGGTFFGIPITKTPDWMPVRN